MTVKELKTYLDSFPDNIPVAFYAQSEEADAPVLTCELLNMQEYLNTHYFNGDSWFEDASNLQICLLSSKQKFSF